MDARRAYEWKVNFGLWTALALLAGLLVRDEVKLLAATKICWGILFVLIIIVYIFIWSAGLHRRNAQNRRDANHFWGLATKDMDLDKDSIDKFKVTPVPSMWKDWSRLSQISFTLILAIIAGIALLHGNKTYGDKSSFALSQALSNEGSCLCLQSCAIPMPKQEQFNPSSKPK
jgi:hypothetical protein